MPNYLMTSIHDADVLSELGDQARKDGLHTSTRNVRASEEFIAKRYAEAMLNKMFQLLTYGEHDVSFDCGPKGNFFAYEFECGMDGDSDLVSFNSAEEMIAKLQSDHDKAHSDNVVSMWDHLHRGGRDEVL